jgi:hypothetical protein
MSTPAPELAKTDRSVPWLLYVFLAPMVLLALAGVVAVVVALLPRST